MRLLPVGIVADIYTHASGHFVADVVIVVVVLAVGFFAPQLITSVIFG